MCCLRFGQEEQTAYCTIVQLVPIFTDETILRPFFGVGLVLRLYNSLPVILVSAVVAATASAQQQGVSLSPFVSFPHSGEAGTLAGLTIGVTDGPFSVRASGLRTVSGRSGTRSRASTSVSTSISRPRIARSIAVAKVCSATTRWRSRALTV